MIHIVYVVHNAHPADAASLPVFLSWKRKHPGKVGILAADNSDRDYKAAHPVDTPAKRKSAAAFFNEVEYLDTGDNPGLPAAYNQAMKKILQKDSGAWIMMADEDTVFPEEYLEKALQVLASPPEGLTFMTGLIRSGGRPMSPTKGYHRKTLPSHYVEKAGHYRNIFCINSGLIISGRELESVGGYDEDYFLDMTDHDLMERLSSAGKNNAVVLPVTVEQQFSGRSSLSLEAQKKRFGIYKKDYSTFCRKHGKSGLYCRTEIAKRWLMLYSKYAVCRAGGRNPDAQ